ncbi:MAG: prepilin-type N-terminal cleavage/methylation domain-containing protein [Zetaproteobacteria bacterium]|nr:MAG: prepilin-type N-terminal cleavage/methylation domain-containing protein [Zetaproteobacteria bacterium]
MMHRLHRTEKGFTLIELMIVVAIIGILAAIAIPQFSSFRKKAYNSAALSDLKGAITQQEAYFSDYQTYASSPTVLNAQSSNNVTLTITSASSSDYSMNTRHSSGDTTYQVTGSVGRINATKDGVTTTM